MFSRGILRWEQSVFKASPLDVPLAEISKAFFSESTKEISGILFKNSIVISKSFLDFVNNNIFNMPSSEITL